MSTALFKALEDLLVRHALRGSSLTVFHAAWVLRLSSLPIVLAVLLLVEGGFTVREPQSFWRALTISGTLNVVATFLYVVALKWAPVAYVVPLTALNPLLLTVSSWLVLGEHPTFPGFVGILFVVGGLMLVYRGGRPTRHSSTQKGRIGWGVAAMVLVVLCWTVTAPTDKVGIQASTPLTWAAAAHLWVVVGTLVISGVVLMRKGAGWTSQPVQQEWHSRHWRQRLLYLVGAGVCSAGMLVTHMLGLAGTLVPYLISLKRLSIVLAVLGSWRLLGESVQRRQVVGAILCACGAVVLVLWG